MRTIFGLLVYLTINNKYFSCIKRTRLLNTTIKGIHIFSNTKVTRNLRRMQLLQNEFAKTFLSR